jgi:putative transposase
MPRQSHIDAPGALHHIICRGIERRKIFLHNADKDDFISRLGAILTETATCCFAWALIPNHFHLLLRTGHTPIASVMQRVLTGYAVSFNRRHRRHGHLFQNRYKSILCQEEPYLLELVRYIHLNPLRAGVVSSMEGLDAYPYTGHYQILGQNRCSWMVTDEILKRFDEQMATARNRYSQFMVEGVKQGKNPNLTGGGLVRSVGAINGLFLRQKREITTIPGQWALHSGRRGLSLPRAKTGRDSCP